MGCYCRWLFWWASLFCLIAHKMASIEDTVIKLSCWWTLGLSWPLLGAGVQGDVVTKEKGSFPWISDCFKASTCFWLQTPTLPPAWVHHCQNTSGSLCNTWQWLSWFLVVLRTGILGTDFRRTVCLGQVKSVMEMGARSVQEKKGGRMWICLGLKVRG